MSATQIISGAPGDVTASRTRRRWPAAIRRVAALAAVGVIAGAAVMAGSAMASAGTQSGNLIFRPATGALTLTPTWTTTAGCPAGYRQSAQMSVFSARGTFLSRISPAVYNVTTAFTGTLDGSMSEIMHFAKVTDGGKVEFAVGCYTQPGGTGDVQWVQSAIVTLSSAGTSYTAAAASSSPQTAPGSPGGSQVSATGNGQSVASTTTANSSGMGGGAEAGLIAGCCAVVVAIIGFVLYRRRQDRSRLM
jgi:hypothetical protein